MKQVVEIIGCVIFASSLVISGCVTEQQSASGQPAQAQQQASENTAPPDSPMAQIRVGMGLPEVLHRLGQPTDQESAVTGKAFIPYYFGGDTSITRMHYKGLGRIYVSGGAAFGGGNRVTKIEYDPQESGFRK